MPKRQLDDLSRAEKIRARRKQSRKGTPKVPFEGNASRKQPRNKAPVTRRQVSHVPSRTHKGQKAQTPLRRKGSKLQLSGMPRFQLGWRIISGAIFLFSLMVVISLSGLNAFTISTINLVGAQRLTAETIISQLDIVGSSIISVQPEVIEANLTSRFPELRSASVVIGLPASITIQIEERQPEVLWNQHETTLWIDAEGVMFPIRGEADPTVSVIANSEPPAASSNLTMAPDGNQQPDDFPIPGETIFPQTTPEFVQGILALAHYIPDGSQLQYDPRFGLGWQDPHGWLVYFGGDTNHIDIKLAEYQRIIMTLQEENITPSLISLEFLHAPFYRLEQ